MTGDTELLDQQPARDQQLQAVALALFDGAAPVHALPAEARWLLQAAAACYAAARQAGAERADRVGRDIALAAPIAGLTPEQRCIVASAVAFQRDKLRRNREPAFLRLSGYDQEIALRLAALLQLADAISAAPGSRVLAQATNGRLRLVVGGAQAAAVAAEVDRHAQRWRKVIGEVTIVAGEDGEAIPAPASNLTDGREAPFLSIELPAPGTPEYLSGDEPIAEGARRMLRRTFERMLAREEGVRADEDPEEVHQMRVATRKLRASLQIVEAIYTPKLIRQFRRKLRRVARALGVVRDNDVFLLDLQAYRQLRAEHEQAALMPLAAAVEQARAQAHAALLEDLDSQTYARFKHDFAVFLTTPGAGVRAISETGLEPRVRDQAGSMIWQRYEQLRAFEVVMPHAPDAMLHQARIAGKRLRYTLEFFADALGPEVDQVLEPLVALQENLGHIQDSAVAHAHVHALELADDVGAQAYLAARVVSREQHLSHLPALWEQVAGAAYRRQLCALIGQM